VTDVIGPTVEALLSDYDTALADFAATTALAANGGTQ